MFAAAADTIAALAHPTGTGAALLPPVTDLQTVRQIHQAMWRPEYPHSNRSESRSINATDRDLRLPAATRPFC